MGVSEPGMSWRDVAQGAAANFPKSAMQFGADLVSPVTEPVETAKGLMNLGLGIIQKAIPGEQPNEATADAVGAVFR